MTISVIRERMFGMGEDSDITGQVEGDRCYQDLASIPGGVQAVVIGTRPAIAEDTMREGAGHVPSKCETSTAHTRVRGT